MEDTSILEGLTSICFVGKKLVNNCGVQSGGTKHSVCFSMKREVVHAEAHTMHRNKGAIGCRNVHTTNDGTLVPTAATPLYSDCLFR